MQMNPGIEPNVQKTNRMQWGPLSATAGYNKADKYRNGYFLTAVAVYTDVTRTVNNEPAGFGLSSSSLKPKYGNGLSNGYNTIIPNYGSGTHSGAPYYYPTATAWIYHPIYKSSAVRYCHEKNRDINGDGFIDASETKWYLPSQQELQMIWIANTITSSFSTVEKYFTASQHDHGNSYYGWIMKFPSGDTFSSGNISQGSIYRVRCVRNL